MMKSKIKVRWVLMVIAIILLYRGPALVKRIQKRERITQIRNYLKEEYPGVRFRVNASTVTTNDPFEITFTAGQKFDDAFYDDYRQQLVKHIADELEIPCTVENFGIAFYDSGTTVIVYYQDYDSIDDMSERFAELIQTCRSYEILRTRGPVLTITPNHIEEPFFPGYTLSISKSSKSESSSDYLARKIKENYIYTMHNFAIPTDGLIPDEDIREYQKAMPGTVIMGEEGAEAVLPMVSIRLSGPRNFALTPCVDFGGVYQILESQGAEMKAGHNEFTASFDGKTMVFECEYQPKGPLYKYYNEDSGSGSTYEFIRIEDIEKMINKKIVREERTYE